MVTNWTVRDEILSLSQRWHWLVSAFLLGSLLGWGISWILPPVYQAQVELYVAINADTEFTNPDDYKNWQMGQLDAFIMSENVIQGLLSQLQDLDADWDGYTVQDLRPMLSVRWRNAGKWRLVVTANESEKASMLAQVWHDVVLEQVSEAIVHAGRFGQVDRELDAVTYELLLTREHTLGLNQANDALSSWRDDMLQSQSTTPLDQVERWHLQSLAARLSFPDRTLQDILADMPPPDAGVQDYPVWVEQVLGSLEENLGLQQEWERELLARQEQLSQLWAEEEVMAHGLSAYLHIEPLTGAGVTVQAARTPAIAALVGGFLGMIGWVAARLSRLPAKP